MKEFVIRKAKLLDGEKVLMCLKEPFWGNHISVVDNNDQEVMETYAEAYGENTSLFYCTFSDGRKIEAEASCNPTDWSISRIPLKTEVKFSFSGMNYNLIRLSESRFILQNKSRSVLEFLHHNTLGGWNVIANDSISLQFLMMVFIFTRYLERANEFYVV